MARDLGISRETLRLWVRQAQAAGGPQTAKPVPKRSDAPLPSGDVEVFHRPALHRQDAARPGVAALDLATGRLYYRIRKLKRWREVLSQIGTGLATSVQRLLLHRHHHRGRLAHHPLLGVVATQNKAIPPELERFIYQRAKSRVYETAASHVPMISQPSVVTRIIQDAARAVD